MTVFEIFQDPNYFDMWCLRQKSDKEFAMTLHFPDRNQAVHAKSVILELLKRDREACATLVEKSYGGWTTKMLVMAIRARGE